MSLTRHNGSQLEGTPSFPEIFVVFPDIFQCCRIVLCVTSYLSYIFPGGSMVKNLPANAGDTGNEGLIPGLGKSPGEGNGNPLQYSCLENPLDRGAWQATVRRVTKSRTRLKRLSTHTHANGTCLYSTRHRGNRN